MKEREKTYERMETHTILFPGRAADGVLGPRAGNGVQFKVGDGFNPRFKESRKIRGVRPDYIDFDNKIIYELKPMNPRSVRSGVRQLQRYNKAFGGGFTLRLELY